MQRRSLLKQAIALVGGSVVGIPVMPTAVAAPVASGTYTAVTVDTRGRVVCSNPEYDREYQNIWCVEGTGLS